MTHVYRFIGIVPWVKRDVTEYSVNKGTMFQAQYTLYSV